MPVPTYAETLHLASGGTNAVPQGRCRGEVHGDLACGRFIPDLNKCEWCIKYENLKRYLCLQCSRTDTAPGEAHSWHPNPAKQRKEGGVPLTVSISCDGWVILVSSTEEVEEWHWSAHGATLRKGPLLADLGAGRPAAGGRSHCVGRFRPFALRRHSC